MAFLGLLVKAIALGATILITQYIVTYLQSPLKKLPGPFLAKFSNVWRFLNHYGQTHIETQRKLHEKYGDYVRLGPNTVSIADASLIKTIYNTRGTFVKSDFYWWVHASHPKTTIAIVAYMSFYRNMRTNTDEFVQHQRRPSRRPPHPQHVQHA
jgi:hypothetical protein